MFITWTPIVAGREIALRAHLRAFPEDGRSPLARVAGTHFARWVIVPELKWEGPRQHPDALKSQYLLFSACYDGDLHAWLDGLRDGLGDEVDAIWGNCAGFSGRNCLKHYLLHNQLRDTALFFNAYDAPVEHVRSSLERQVQVREFVLAHQTADDADLWAAWSTEFGWPAP
jgi:hypothetical protein